MKFKKGNKVKLKEPCSGSVPERVYTLSDKNKQDGVCTDMLWAWDKKTSECGCCCEDNFILLTKMGKEKPIKYILKYDIQDEEDPYENFATLDEVKKRIEQMIADGDGIVLSSVRVYEVKSIAKVETNITFK